MSIQRAKLTPDILEAKQRRLEMLEVQAATYGIDVPAHISAEIRMLQSEIELADIVNRPALDPKIATALRQTDDRDLLGKFIGDHARRLTQIELWQVKRDERLDKDDATRAIRQHKHDIWMGLITAGTLINLLIGFSVIAIVIVILTR